MKLVERHIIKGDKQLTELCRKSKNLYNQSLYYLRQSVFGKIERFTEYELTTLYAKYNDENYRSLPAQTSQQTVKKLFKNFRSYLGLIKKWKENPNTPKPKLPNYKKDQFAVFFCKQQVSVKNGFVHVEKKSIIPLRTNVSNICEVRVIPQPTCHIIEIVYDKETSTVELNKDNVLSLDLGLSNLATSANNVGLPPFIINGKSIKAFNQWYNKTRALLQTQLPKGQKSSKGIYNLNLYRNCWAIDKMHKISRYIVDYCIENNIGRLIIGRNKNWKDGLNIGVKNNQHFSIMPLSLLTDKLKYKAELAGILFTETEESYTSKCDSLSSEPIQKHETYLGKRVKRGLFQSATGIRINADLNGAINIARKVIGNDFVKNILNSSCALQPYRVQIL